MIPLPGTLGAFRVDVVTEHPASLVLIDPATDVQIGDVSEWKDVPESRDGFVVWMAGYDEMFPTLADALEFAAARSEKAIKDHHEFEAFKEALAKRLR